MKTILIHGASTAAGWYDMERAGWVNRLHLDALHANEECPQEAISIQNASIPGNTLLGIMKDIDRVDRYKKLGSVTAILAIGLNESKIMKGRNRPLVSLDKFQSALDEYGNYVESRGGNLVYLGTEALLNDTIVTENGNTFEDDLVAEYDALIQQQAAKTGSPYVSMEDLFSQIGIESAVAADGYHPNAFGHELIYRSIKRQLALRELGSLEAGAVPVDITSQLA
jgi:lysophospholipase L1-like esterase